MSNQKAAASTDLVVLRRRPGQKSVFTLFCRVAEKILEKPVSAKTR